MSRSSYPSWKTNKFVSRFFQYLILSIIMVLVFVPVVMLVFGALKTRGELLTHPYSPPIPPRWENITGILATPIFWELLRNSLFVMIVVTLAVVVICSLAAFKGTGIQSIYIGTDVPHQYRHPARLFCIAPVGFDR